MFEQQGSEFQAVWSKKEFRIPRCARWFRIPGCIIEKRASEFQAVWSNDEVQNSRMVEKRGSEFQASKSTKILDCVIRIAQSSKIVSVFSSTKKTKTILEDLQNKLEIETF